MKNPTTFVERREIADTCVKKLNLSITTLVDNMDNEVDQMYAGYPDRIYVIDVNGRVEYQGERGPWGFRPEEMEKALEGLVGENILSKWKATWRGWLERM